MPESMSNYNAALSAVSEKRNNAFFDFLKVSLLMASTLLGIIVSLTDKSTDNNAEFAALLCLIVLFALCILIGLILLYGHFDIYERLWHQGEAQRIGKHHNEDQDQLRIYVSDAVWKKPALIAYATTYLLAVVNIPVYAWFAFC